MFKLNKNSLKLRNIAGCHFIIQVTMLSSRFNIQYLGVPVSPLIFNLGAAHKLI